MAAAMAELWETAKHAISSYTGLSPATFFTLLVVAVTFYHFISGFLAPPPLPPRRRETELEAMEPLKPPVQLGEVSEAFLSAYDGSDPSKPLLMAIKSQIYDVTQSRMFYGPGGPYALFAGKDASRALAKMSFEQKDLTGDISGLGPFELDALQDWEYKFMSKYTKVGTVKKTEDATCAETSETAETETASAETASEEHKETPVDRAEAAESKTKEVESEGADAGEGTKVDHSEEPEETPVDRAEAAESKTKEAESEGADAGEGTKV